MFRWILLLFLPLSSWGDEIRMTFVNESHSEDCITLVASQASTTAPIKMELTSGIRTQVASTTVSGESGISTMLATLVHNQMKESRSETLDLAPGPENPGYYRIEISPSGPNHAYVTAKVESHMPDLVASLSLVGLTPGDIGLQFPMRWEFSAEVQFTSGNWQTFQSGGQVEFLFTGEIARHLDPLPPAVLKKIRERLAALLSKHFRESGFRVENILIGVENVDRVTARGTRTRLEFRGPSRLGRTAFDLVLDDFIFETPEEGFVGIAKNFVALEKQVAEKEQDVALKSLADARRSALFASAFIDLAGVIRLKDSGVDAWQAFIREVESGLVQLELARRLAVENKIEEKFVKGYADLVDYAQRILDLLMKSIKEAQGSQE